MTIDTRYGEPTQIQAGDTVSWKKTSGPYTLRDGTSADFPTSESMTLKYRIVGGGLTTPVLVSAVAADGEYTITLAASDTSGQVSPATPRMIGWFENADDDERYVIYDGRLVVEPNLETATAAEAQTYNERVLELIEARIEGRFASGADLDSYGVAGRSVSKIPAGELLKQRGIFRALVQRERNGGNAIKMHRGQFTAVA